MVNDILLEMLARGWPLTKAAYLVTASEPDFPDFPLHAEVWARVPSWLPGPMPRSVGDLLSIGGVVRSPKGPLTLLRAKGWPWTKATYIKALYYPRKPDAELTLQDALDVWVPPNLPGKFPESARDITVTDVPPEGIALAKRIRWPSARAVAVAMHTRSCGKDEAIIELLTQQALIKRVMLLFTLSRENAAIAITRVEPIAGALMERHALTKDIAIIELIRGGA